MSVPQLSLDQRQAVDTVLSHLLKDPSVSAKSGLRGVKCSVCVCVYVCVCRGGGGSAGEWGDTQGVFVKR